MDAAIQQYAEPHLAARLQQPSMGKSELNPDALKCTDLGGGVAEEAAQKCSGVNCQRHKDSTTLVAEGPRGYQCEFPNPYGQLHSTTWKPSGCDNNQAGHGQQLDSDFYTTDQRIETSPMRGIKREVEATDRRKRDMNSGQKVDKRNIRYWERKGLPTEGILMNKKMLLCILTPDKVLWKYFTKVQGALHPDLDMADNMKRNMRELYEKVFERELSAIDGRVSMKFGRAFIAQELKGKRFNWAQYALSEHIRISERNAKKAQRRKYSKQLEDSDQDDDDGTYGLEDEGDVKYQPPSRRLLELHDRDESEVFPVRPGCSNHHYQLAYPPTGPEIQSSMPSALDADLQALRADLKRRLMQTNVMQETLREFDSHILQYISEKSRVGQEKEDLNLALALVEHKCKLLESNIYFVVGRAEMEKGCVDEGQKKLQEVITRKPTDPERDYTAWKKWCIDLQHHYKYLAYSKHEVVEQESALKKLQSEYDAATAERKTLFKKLLQLDDSNTPESAAESDEDLGRGPKSRRLRL